MAVTNKEVEAFEKEYKSAMFEKIHGLAAKQTELLSQIQKQAKIANTNGELPNIGITFNNKLVELSHEFQEAGISIFSAKIEDYGLLKLNMVGPSFLGTAIIIDMTDRVKQGVQYLEQYSLNFEQMAQNKQKKVQELEKSGPIKRTFLMLRGLLIPEKRIDFSYTQEETEKLNSYLSQYDEVDQNMWNYNLRDNIVSSLVNYIKVQGYSKEEIPGILEESIVPDLQKLGLSDLIPELKEKLEKSLEEAWKGGKLGELPPEIKRRMQQGQQEIAQKNMEGTENTTGIMDVVEESIEVDS